MNSPTTINPIPALWPSYCRSLRAAGRSDATLRAYRQTLEGFTGWCARKGYPTDPRDQTKRHVEEFLVDLQRDSTSSTVATRFRGLRRWYNWLVEEEEIDKSPMARMKSPTVDEMPPDVFTDAELSAMLKATEGKEFQARRDHALLRLLIDNGLRRGELAAMIVADVNLDQCIVSIPKTKSRRGRVVGFGAKTAQALDRYTRERARHKWADKTDRFWLGIHGPVTGDGIRQVLGAVAREAGVQGSFVHRFRHTFAHRAKMRGISDGDLMQAGGWTSPDVMARYGSSAAAERSRDAMRKLSLGDSL